MNKTATIYYRGDIMNNDTLLETLKSDSMSFTLSEIEEMMNEELNKDPNEMDTDLVDICADIINKAYAQTKEVASDILTNPKDTVPAQKENKRKRIKFGKILLAAAIIAIICVIAVSINAKYVHMEASDNIVRFFENHFNVNLRNGETDAQEHSDPNNELVHQIQAFGIDNVILPAELLSDQYKTDITFTNDDAFYNTVEICFESKNEDISGNVVIDKHKTDDTLFIIGQGQMAEQFNTVKQITVNGMDVLVFGSDTRCFIDYIDNETEYTISVECTFEQAIEIAESLKGK